METLHKSSNTQSSPLEDDLHEVLMLAQIAQASLAQAEFSDECAHCHVRDVRRALAQLTTIVEHALVDLDGEEASDAN